MQSFYCAAPWRGLHINFRGDVKTCCAGNPNLLGNINNEPIQSVLQGKKLRDIRASIKSGVAPMDYCNNCVEAERFGRSERHWHNDVNQDFDCSTADLDDYRPSIVDIRWNTTCNLSCNYCNENCSSKWQTLKSRIDIRQDIKAYYADVCDFLEQHRDHIREVAMVGGEPFLLKENETLLDVVPNHAIVTLITNTSLDFENNKIFQKLSSRPKVGWSMSFDNLYQQFEYVRYGASWSRLLANVDLVKTLMRDQGHWGGIHAVYNIYNCTRLTEFRRWVQDQGLTVVWQSSFDPEYIAPQNFPRRLRDQALQEAHDLLSSGLDLSVSEIDFFNTVLSVLDNDYECSDFVPIFQMHIDKIENIYHPQSQGQFKKLWPEISWLMESV